jgi:hypothetical protein
MRKTVPVLRFIKWDKDIATTSATFHTRDRYIIDIVRFVDM